MIRPVLLVYWLFFVRNFLMCSAGNHENVSTLNDILNAKGWKKLVKLAQFQEFKSINGEGMDVSDLLNKGAEGNIVTLANYSDKLIKASTVVSCFYSESQKFINDMFIEIIAGQCMSMGSGDLMLDCMERFCETMDINKSLTEKYLVVLKFFHKSSEDMGTKTVIEALESLLPLYDRQKYILSNYLYFDGTVNMDSFMKDYNFFLDSVKCANNILRNFLMARCLPACNDENEKSEDIEDMAKFTSYYQDIDLLFDLYVQNLHVPEKSLLNKLGYHIIEQLLRV